MTSCIDIRRDRPINNAVMDKVLFRAGSVMDEWEEA
jgi:hypothetical protein